MYSCKYAGGRPARWALGSDEAETEIRSVSVRGGVYLLLGLVRGGG